jgi:hypothetical protein
MTIEELKARPDFVTDLNDQQKAFVLALCSNGKNKIEAAKMAYPGQADSSLQATANRALRHPVIARLVRDFYGRTDETGSKAEVLAIVWKKIQSPGLSPAEMLAYLKFQATLKGWDAPKPAKEDEPEADFSFLEEEEK